MLGPPDAAACTPATKLIDGRVKSAGRGAKSTPRRGPEQEPCPYHGGSDTLAFLTKRKRRRAARPKVVRMSRAALARPDRHRRCLADACLLLACLALPGPAMAGPWLDGGARPGASVQQALALLSASADDGLDPRDYAAEGLARRAQGLTAATSVDTAQAAAFEQALQVAFLRYLRDLHQGRVDPRALGVRLGPAPRPAVDLPARLGEALATNRLPELAAALRPALGQYTRLRSALALYRRLATAPGLPPLPATPSARPGMAYPSATTLHQRLLAEGDLPPDSPAPATAVYDESLAAGVARFQARHGLAPDGVLGRATREALNAPPSRLVRQIELAMERLRWLPPLDGQRFIGINIPMFRLWAWDPAQPAAAPLAMNVVVGRALKTQTPVLAEQMQQVIFRPYWNVPRSIALQELLPELAKDPPASLERQSLELVQGPGDDAKPVPADAEALARLQQGTLRLRQRAGDGNALGLVKFVFPNDDNVYLHGTPATRLFGRPRRDFSHGCVRVEDPAALAQWVLAEQPEWTRERIEATMQGTVPSVRVTLASPLTVILFYTTAMVMPGEPGVRFADDIYRHDARLERALANRRVPGALR
jgi:murein L,D-transpeptidase YcbB/YkuD